MVCFMLKQTARKQVCFIKLKNVLSKHEFDEIQSSKEPSKFQAQNHSEEDAQHPAAENIAKRPTSMNLKI